MISGIALALKTLKPSVKVFGVTVDQTPGMLELKKGLPLSARKFIATIADGIAIKQPSTEMFQAYINQYVDDIVEVTDEEIAQAIVYLLEAEKSVVEGSGAAGVAAVLNDKIKLSGPTCIVLCGGNIDLNLVTSVIDTGLLKQGRMARISTIVNDLPGALAKMTKLFAEGGANVIDVVHDRVSPELNVRQTRIDFHVETLGNDHIRSLVKSLKKAGIKILESKDGELQ